MKLNRQYHNKSNNLSRILLMKKILVLWIVILFLLYATLSVVRHNHFQSGGFDLGIFDQTIWLYAHFLAPYNSIKEQLILGDHLNLTLPLLAPLFWLWDDVRMLLIFQAGWISLSTYAIYELCRHRKFTPLISLIVSIIYSLFYGIQAAIFFDFHAVIIGVGLIAWLTLFLETGKKKLFLLTLALLLLTQENMGIALISLAAVYFWKKPFRKISLAFIVIGIFWSIVSSKLITVFSQSGFGYLPQISNNPVTILINFFDSEEKRRVWLYSFSWFSFLPLLSPGSMIAVFIDLAQYFVTGPEFARMWSPLTHHRAILAPFLTLGMLDALEFFQKRQFNTQPIALAALVVALSLQYLFHFPLNKLAKSSYWQNEQWVTDTDNLIRRVPTNASVAAQQNLIPHLSHRREIYLLWPTAHDFNDKRCGVRTCWWLDFDPKADFLVVNVNPGQSLTQLLETPEHFNLAVNNMEKSKIIELLAQIGDAKLYKIIK